MPKTNKVPIRQSILDTLSWLSARNNNERTFERKRVLKFVKHGTKKSQDNELRALKQSMCVLCDKHTITILPKGLDQAKTFRPFQSNEEALREAGSQFSLPHKAQQILRVLFDGNKHTIQELHESIGEGMILKSFQNIIGILAKWELSTRCKDADGNDAIVATDYIFPMGRPRVARVEAGKTWNQAKPRVAQQEEVVTHDVESRVEQDECKTGQVTEGSSQEGHANEEDSVVLSEYSPRDSYNDDDQYQGVVYL